MAGIVIKINDKSKDVLSKLDSIVIPMLEECGLVCEGYAKQVVRVDTGNLRNSITHTVSEEERKVYTGTNVEYAAYVEKGTSRSRAYPYLEPAMADHVPEYESILTKWISTLQNP